MPQRPNISVCQCRSPIVWTRGPTTVVTSTLPLPGSLRSHQSLVSTLYVTDTDAHAKPVLVDFTSEFAKKLCADCDNVNLIYCWALAAALDGRRNTLHWMRRIWNNPEDWPNVVEEYDTLAKFQAMLKKEMTALVSSVLICGLCLCKCVHPTVDSFGRYQVSFVPLHARLWLLCISP